ncbi:hypothetical protein LTR97_005192 [Elasticomyces elasticus]|uniref:F-box domain-containing protein n=1 Tax=Elasticomyces elasticus TaxID=574655 RepID=A0AAN7W9Q3_9PEZI|nr:hypothetical protein LTR97_005192 [Elasticomyces elasticus]
MKATKPSRLDRKIPPELLTLICNHLDTTQDLCSVRLVSRNMYRSAWPAFGRLFDHKTVCLTREGIRVLSLVGPHITHLRISSKLWSHEPLKQLRAWYLAAESAQTRDQRKEMYVEYSTIVEPECNHCWLGHSTRALARALRGMKRLERLTIVHGSDSHVRSPRSYFEGKKVCAKLTAAEEHIDYVYGRNVYHETLRIVFDGLAIGGRSTCERIRCFNFSTAVQFDDLAPFVIRDLNRSMISNSGHMVWQLAGITHLRLDLELPRHTDGKVVVGGGLNTRLPTFLNSMRCLISLRLVFPREYWDIKEHNSLDSYATSATSLFGLATLPGGHDRRGASSPASDLDDEDSDSAGPTLPGGHDRRGASSPESDLDDEDSDSAGPTNHVIQYNSAPFPYLRTLELASLPLKSAVDLIAFLTRHKLTLRNLTLRAITLGNLDTEWIDFICSLHPPRMDLDVFRMIPFMDVAQREQLYEQARFVPISRAMLNGCAKDAQLVDEEG